MRPAICVLRRDGARFKPDDSRRQFWMSTAGLSRGSDRAMEGGGDWLALKSDWLALKRLICNDEHNLAVANASREDAMLLDCLHILKTDCTGLARRWVRMKKLLSVLGILAIGGVVAAGCSSQSQIDQATSQADGSAQRAATGAHHESLADEIGSEQLVIDLPVKFRRASGEVRLVLPPRHAREPTPRLNMTLIKTLDRALRWKEVLLSDPAASFSSIAKSVGYTQRYVMRVLRLAFLAPDIVTSIVEGNQPTDLELDQLLNQMPITWADQRRAFGFI